MLAMALWWLFGLKKMEDLWKLIFWPEHCEYVMRQSRIMVALEVKDLAKIMRSSAKRRYAGRISRNINPMDRALIFSPDDKPRECFGAKNKKERV